MPEIKNTFQLGKMNKDLDERLIQSGEYRDALNVNIGRSEGSDVGALENLLGNEALSSDVIGTCIGSIRYDLEEKIYWFVSGSPDTIYEYDETTGDVSTILKGDGLNFSTDSLITGINIIEGLLFWTDDRNEPRKINIEKFKNANHEQDTTRIYGREFTDSDITVIKPHPKRAITLRLGSDPESDQPPFEEIFPRFAYRWRYDDGEFSPFSYFTDVAFVPAAYISSEHFKEGYNTAMRNTVNSVTLREIPRGTPDVVSVDVLYTESISSTVYTIRTIVKEDFGNNPLFIDDQTFTKRSFYSAVPNNQLSRAFDNVPQLAKSQEVTANRLVYANYLQNFDQPENVSLGVTQLEDRTSISGPSVKGNRDYELGVVYEDQFGRQGGLITGDESTYTSRFNTNGTQRLSAVVNSIPPEWATHFKYYVKDSSMDHHNFVSYNTYNDGTNAQEGSEFIWLQIPSDDRNKVSEDSFLVPRRHSHGGIVAPTGNALGFNSSAGSTSAFNSNVAGSSARRTYDRFSWYSGGNSPDRRSATGGLSTATGANPDSFQNGVFTAEEDGTYTLVFTGTLDADVSSSFNHIVNSNFLRLRSGIQVAKAGEEFSRSVSAVDPASRGDMADIRESGGIQTRSFSSFYSINLQRGDRVRAAIISIERRGTGSVSTVLSDLQFGTLTTPGDPDSENRQVEPDGVIFPEFSRHKVIDIENEAPDIVRAQLPVDLRKLGNTLDYGNTSDNRLYLVQDVEANDDTEDTTGYGPASDVLTYQASDGGEGLEHYRFIAPLNRVLNRAGEPQLNINIGEPATTLQPSERTITVDVSEIEGGLFLGIGGAGSLAQTGTGDKHRITEISVGFNADELSEHERANISFVLADPVGVNPIGQSVSIFKGDITDNALKNLQGSFFVKTSRATNNASLPELPTGQSAFDDDNNISDVRAIWFETIPAVEDSNLNLFWESSGSIPIDRHGSFIPLDFTNCISFAAPEGTFIETQRVFDRFNSVQINKGIRVNVPQEGYGLERRQFGLIWSGIFNSRSSVNRLNQFIQADGITKEIEPNYGSIQKLHTRDTNVVVFAEDKIFKILADKDLLFNADGGGNVSAANSVLGQTTPYVGEYGISLNPESFSTYGNRMYFADRNRGVVLRLSNDGLTEISGAGTNDFFRDLLADSRGPIWGSFDDYTNHYNISFSDFTISFEEDTRGWTSRKSFVPESGLSLNNRYYTWKNGNIYVHNSRNVPRNNFYGTQYNSTITTIFNLEPSSIKNFKTLNYEGTPGWSSPLILTDQEAGYVNEFTMKEGKWFSHLSGFDNTEIIPMISRVRTLGAQDFYDIDGLEGGVYEFNNGSDTGLPCDVLGIGFLDSIEKLGGGDPTPVELESTITFNVV